MTISLGSWSKELLDRLTMYLIPNQGHHSEFEPGKDQCFDGLFLYKSVSYKLWKNSKVFNCRARKT